MSAVRAVAQLVLWVFWVALIARLVLGYVQMFARDWRPRGIVLVIAESVYTVTDPPLRFFRRLLPPFRLGSVSLDLGFIVLFLAVGAAMNVLARWP